MAKPLSAVPLGAVTECKAKSGGKHEGKFYVDTLSRSFKLVATSQHERDSWVEAINRGSAHNSRTYRTAAVRPLAAAPSKQSACQRNVTSGERCNHPRHRDEAAASCRHAGEPCASVASQLARCSTPYATPTATRT